MLFFSPFQAPLTIQLPAALPADRLSIELRTIRLITMGAKEHRGLNPFDLPCNLLRTPFPDNDHGVPIRHPGHIVMEDGVLPTPDYMAFPIELQQNVCTASRLTETEICRLSRLTPKEQIPSWKEETIARLAVKRLPVMNNLSVFVEEKHIVSPNGCDQCKTMSGTRISIGKTGDSEWRPAYGPLLSIRFLRPEIAYERSWLSPWFPIDITCSFAVCYSPLGQRHHNPCIEISLRL
jgi:hypothetical protein